MVKLGYRCSLTSRSYGTDSTVKCNRAVDVTDTEFPCVVQERSLTSRNNAATEVEAEAVAVDRLLARFSDAWVWARSMTAIASASPTA